MQLENYQSPWMDAELSAFGDSIRRFVRERMVPHEEEWRAQHQVDRDIWLACGEMGMILPDIPSEYGGADGTLTGDVVAEQSQPDDDEQQSR